MCVKLSGAISDCNKTKQIFVKSVQYPCTKPGSRVRDWSLSASPPLSKRQAVYLLGIKPTMIRLHQFNVSVNKLGKRPLAYPKNTQCMMHGKQVSRQQPHCPSKITCSTDTTYVPPCLLSISSLTEKKTMKLESARKSNRETGLCMQTYEHWGATARPNAKPY